MRNATVQLTPQEINLLHKILTEIPPDFVAKIASSPFRIDQEENTIRDLIRKLGAAANRIQKEARV